MARSDLVLLSDTLKRALQMSSQSDVDTELCIALTLIEDMLEQPATVTGWQAYKNSDETEGRGPMVAYGPIFETEQEAWDFCKDHGGIMGRHPRNFTWGDWAGCSNWQEYAAKNKYGDIVVRKVG